MTLYDVERRLHELDHMEPLVVLKEASEAAKKFCDELICSGERVAFLYPLKDGGVHVDINIGGIDAEVEIEYGVVSVEFDEEKTPPVKGMYFNYDKIKGCAKFLKPVAYDS